MGSRYSLGNNGAETLSPSDLAKTQYGTKPRYRRSKTGCIACRLGRVKCDEIKPICERCTKGKRQCDFVPPTSAPSKKPKPASTPSSQTGREEKETSPVTGSEAIKDEIEDEPQTRPRLDRLRTNSTQSLTGKQKWRQHSEASATSSASKEKVTTPSTDTSSSQSRSQTLSSSLQTNPSPSTSISRASRWADRGAEVQKYLQYHDEHITFLHYFLKFDIEDCIHTELTDLALTYEPLLYAVVAFSAYQYALKQPDGQLSNFLTYYSKSVNLLMKSLARGAEHTEATLLTVLQLATIEEYLGDWVNLVGHQRAAHHMLSKLYTSENVMETELPRVILAWYTRFDLVAGLMAGNETVLDRRWYVACSDWYEEHIDTEGLDVTCFLQYIIAQNRLLWLDVAALFSKLAKGTVDMETFQIENASITSRLQTLKSRTEGFNHPYYRVTGFPYRAPLTADGIVNPYMTGGLLCGDLWPFNFAWSYWYGLNQIHKYQTSLALGMSVFLREDGIIWACQKLAQIERMGYVFPPAFRAEDGLAVERA